MPEKTAEIAAGKVKGHMLEMQELARKEAVREGAVENVSYGTLCDAAKLISSH